MPIEGGSLNKTRRQPWRFALVVISDKAVSGERSDACLPQMRSLLPSGAEVVIESIIPDERHRIESLLRELSDMVKVDCVLTSGGTGLGARDVTPQATSAIGDYEVPGLAEAMRAASISRVPTAMLSRAVAAVRRRTLIVNLPGSPKAVRETLSVIIGIIPHALELLRGEVSEHDINVVR